MHCSKDGAHRYASETVSTTCSRGYCCQHLYGVNGVQKYIYIVQRNTVDKLVWKEHVKGICCLCRGSDNTQRADVDVRSM